MNNLERCLVTLPRSQSRRERRPTLAASRSYQKIHVSPRPAELAAARHHDWLSHRG